MDGFVCDEAAMRSLITRWLALADDYDDSIRRDSLGAVDPPGADFASEAVAAAANASGRAYLDYLTESRRYCLDQARLLQDTLDDYLGTEHQNVITLSTSHEDG